MVLVYTNAEQSKKSEVNKIVKNGKVKVMEKLKKKAEPTKNPTESAKPIPMFQDPEFQKAVLPLAKYFFTKFTEMEKLKKSNVARDSSPGNHYHCEYDCWPCYDDYGCALCSLLYTDCYEYGCELKYPGNC